MLYVILDINFHLIYATTSYYYKYGMYSTKFTTINDTRTRKIVKLRKGRVGLLIAFIIFLVMDIFLVGEYKARGVNAVGYQLMEKIGGIIETGDNILGAIWNPELAHEDNITSALLVGIDTRDVAFDGNEFYSTDPDGQHGTRNTDTIIQVVYDHNEGRVFMISIPRDIGVDVEKDCLEFHGSIHWVYDKAQGANCPGGGVQTLVETVENVTGIKVHYYGFVSLEAFTDIIDAIGETNEEGEHGIWIDNPSVVYDFYPLGDTGWENVYFPEGRQFLTSEDALKYARSRKASSDFARSRRQQIVIQAVKDKVLSSDTLLSPNKLLELFDIFRNKTIISEISLKEMRAALNIARDLQEDKMYTIVLEPKLGGSEALINRQPHDRNTAQYYMVPTHWADCPGNEFCRVQEYIQSIIEYPQIYEEKAKVSVYARGYHYDGKPNLDNSLYQELLQKKLPMQLEESQYLANIPRDEDIVLYDFSDGSKPEVLQYLSSALHVSVVDGSEVPYIRLNKEDFAIVVNASE